MKKQTKAKEIGISPKTPKKSRASSSRSSQKKPAKIKWSLLIPPRKSLDEQIKTFKKRLKDLKGRGIESTDEILFKGFMQSNVTESENYTAILKEVERLRLVEKGLNPHYNDARDLRIHKSNARLVEKENNRVELHLIQEELRNKFNDQEGIHCSEVDFEQLMILCGSLLTLPELLDRKVPVAKIEPFIPSPNHLYMTKLIDLLKSLKNPKKQAERGIIINGDGSISVVTSADTGESLNLNS